MESLDERLDYVAEAAARTVGGTGSSGRSGPCATALPPRPGVRSDDPSEDGVDDRLHVPRCDGLARDEEPDPEGSEQEVDRQADVDLRTDLSPGDGPAQIFSKVSNQRLSWTAWSNGPIPGGACAEQRPEM